MSKEQIEEMAELICNLYANGKCTIDGFICNHNCEYKRRAEDLYNAGCRKASDVARKIFEEIDLIFRNCYEKFSEEAELKLLEPIRQAERFTINEIWHEVAELKKKYTEFVSVDK